MNRIWLRSTLIVILLSVSAMACQAGNVFPALFATATPTTTLTPTVTPSPTATQTPLSTLTPTPMPTGMVQKELENGDTLITDYDAGYSFQLSKDWLAIPATMEDIQAMVNKLKGTNPELADSFRALESINSNALRLFAVNQNKATYEGSLATNLNIMSLQDKVILAIPLDMFLDANVQQIKTSIPTAKVLSSKVYKNANGVEVGIIELELKVKTASGQQVVAYEKVVAIKTKTSMSLITFAGPNGHKDVLSPLFDQVVDTITLFTP